MEQPYWIENTHIYDVYDAADAASEVFRRYLGGSSACNETPFMMQNKRKPHKQKSHRRVYSSSLAFAALEEDAVAMALDPKNSSISLWNSGSVLIRRKQHMV